MREAGGKREEAKRKDSSNPFKRLEEASG